jgi:hypothetical protein
MTLNFSCPAEMSVHCAAAQQAGCAHREGWHRYHSDGTAFGFGQGEAKIRRRAKTAPPQALGGKPIAAIIVDQGGVPVPIVSWTTAVIEARRV